MEQTLKCPICGEPYKGYSHTTVDQSACPKCVAKPTILVVDDDKWNQTYVRNSLKADYTIVTAWDGREGLAAFIGAADDAFALVLSDWSMPYMRGTDMVRSIRNLVPEQKVLMMSSEPEAVRSILKGSKIEDIRVLHKSFTQKVLLEIVNQTIYGSIYGEKNHGS